MSPRSFASSQTGSFGHEVCQASIASSYLRSWLATYSRRSTISASTVSVMDGLDWPVAGFLKQKTRQRGNKEGPPPPPQGGGGVQKKKHHPPPPGGGKILCIAKQ